MGPIRVVTLNDCLLSYISSCELLIQFQHKVMCKKNNPFAPPQFARSSLCGYKRDSISFYVNMSFPQPFPTFVIVFIPPLVLDQSPPKLSFLLSLCTISLPSIKMENATGEWIALSPLSETHPINQKQTSLVLVETFCPIPTRTKTTTVIMSLLKVSE